MENVSDVSEVMTPMSWTTMNNHTIQLKLFVFSLINQVGQFLLKIKLKVRVKLYSIESIIIESESI